VNRRYMVSNVRIMRDRLLGIPVADPRHPFQSVGFVGIAIAIGLAVALVYELPGLTAFARRGLASVAVAATCVLLDFESRRHARLLAVAESEGAQLLRYRRHDYANHLQVISGWAQMGDRERLLAYVRQIAAEMEQESRLCRNLPDPATTELARLRATLGRTGGRLALNIGELEGLTQEGRREFLKGLSALRRLFGGIESCPTGEWRLTLNIGRGLHPCSRVAGPGCPEAGRPCFCAGVEGWAGGLDVVSAGQVAAAQDPAAVQDTISGVARSRQVRVYQRGAGTNGGIVLFPLHSARARAENTPLG
jgi:hypothetical protein